ncbi:MAG TPA: DUF5677 domain-containing protein [Pyrinomonadaceae bacterium]|jgi:hypothetical protein
MRIEEAEKVAEKGYKIAELSYLFMKERYEKSISGYSPRPNFQIRDECLIGLWLRSYSWLKTIPKLNQSSDFQAIATACRSLFEIYVDMLFLFRDQTNETADKLFWWYKSEKLKAAELKLKYQYDNQLEIDNYCSDFIDTEKDEIVLNRQRIWNTIKHPGNKRWTSFDLSQDVKRADKVFSVETKRVLMSNLEEFYEIKYRMMNWDIHSGISGIHNRETQKFSFGNFFYFLDCSSFGILCTMLLLIDFRVNEIYPDFNQMFDNVLLARDNIIVD